MLRDLGRLDEALAVLDRALALAPGLADARYNRAIALLSAGRLAEGFADFDARFEKFGARPDQRRYWAGGPPGQRAVLVRAEQGIGDTIQFARYLPALAARVPRVAFQVHRPLLRLFEGFPGPSVMTSLDAPPPPHALHVPLMSLPHRLGLATIPPMPCLAPDPALAALWEARLAALPGCRVGLVWAGNPTFPADRRRSVAPDGLAPLASVPGVTLLSLQHPARPSTLPLTDWTAELTDFADTAALIAGLDLVIGVDTAVIHLAASLGRPTWLLNRFDGCWRWGPTGSTTPWYPSLRLYRQPSPGDWHAPIAQAAADLARFAALPRP